MAVEEFSDRATLLHFTSCDLKFNNLETCLQSASFVISINCNHNVGRSYLKLETVSKTPRKVFSLEYDFERKLLRIQVINSKELDFPIACLDNEAINSHDSLN